MPDVLNLFELEKLAKEELPQTAYDYYASGAWDEIAIRETRPDGILQTGAPGWGTDDLRAAGAAGTIMVLSSLSTTLIEDVVGVAKGPVWFQLYINKDREFTRDLVGRVEKAGCRTLMVTVDTPEWGRRDATCTTAFICRLVCRRPNRAGFAASGIRPGHGLDRLRQLESDYARPGYARRMAATSNI